MKNETQTRQEQLSPEPEKERRARGTGRVFLIGRIQYYQFYWKGKQIRRSSGSEDAAVAEKLLKDALAERHASKLPGAVRAGLRYTKMRDDLYEHYAVQEKASLQTRRDGTRYIGGTPALDDFFGQYAALEITGTDITAFIKKRKQEGVPPATINRSLAQLRRMFHLAVENKKLLRDDVPVFHLLEEPDSCGRSIEPEEYRQIRGHLPQEYRLLVDVAYSTGMRRGELLKLTWEKVDLLEGVIHLRKADTKARKARTVVLSGAPLAILRAQRLRRDSECPRCAFVFFRPGGKPIKEFRRAWKNACKRAGIAGRLRFHDLRHSVVTDLVDAGVDGATAMLVTGHATREIFDMYLHKKTERARIAGEKLRLFRENGANSGQITTAVGTGSTVTKPATH